jgi:hypothetical protein
MRLAAHGTRRTISPPVIGLLSSTSSEAYASRLAAFHQGLNEAGYTEGRNVIIEYRWAEGHYDRLPAMAADLVARQVRVIAAITTSAALAAKAATATIPIVFEMGTDPIEAGLVASLNRPGGKLTGVRLLNVELAPKRLELLHELVAATSMALLVNPANRNAEIIARDTRVAASTLGLQLQVLYASSEHDLDTGPCKLRRTTSGRARDRVGPFLQYAKQTTCSTTAQSVNTGDLPISRVYRCWRTRELRRKYYRSVPTGRHVRWPDSWGRETRRPSRRPIDED